MKPSATAAHGATNAQAGVIATRPATAPDAAPRPVMCPSRIFSTTNQPPTAAAVATCVLRNASAAVAFAPSAEPALKPNQPNHSKAAPSTTSGIECGRIGSFLKPTRLPRIRASASAAAPALMCTAVPPAKSSTPCPARYPAPVIVSFANVPKSKTQCATGKYTTVTQIATKMPQETNFVRSAIAPEISAGVMIANMSWKATNANSGIGYSPPLFGTASTRPPSPDSSNEPNHADPESPNVNE